MDIRWSQKPGAALQILFEWSGPGFLDTQERDWLMDEIQTFLSWTQTQLSSGSFAAGNSIAGWCRLIGNKFTNFEQAFHNCRIVRAV